MFKCDLCNKSSLPGEKKSKRVIEKKERIYYNVIVDDKRLKSRKFIQYPFKDVEALENLKKDGLFIIKEWETKGWEIKKELAICNKCKEDKNESI